MPSLPTQINVPPNDITAYKYVIVGPKKSGKTSIASKFPNALILEGEVGNAKHLRCKSVDIANWRDFVDIVGQLEKAPKGYCDTIVIDNLPSFHRYCQDYICAQKGIEYPGDQSHGKAWSALDLEFNKQMVRLHALGLCMVYTAHTKMVEHEKASGGKYTKLECEGGAAAIRFVDVYSHLWGVLELDPKGQRYLRIQGNQDIKAGAFTNEHFQDSATGKPIERIPLGNSPDEAYKNIELAFHNMLAVGTPGAKPQNPVTLPKPAVKVNFKKPGESSGL